jgi:hypothetical protein
MSSAGLFDCSTLKMKEGATMVTITIGHDGHIVNVQCVCLIVTVVLSRWYFIRKAKEAVVQYSAIVYYIMYRG